MGFGAMGLCEPIEKSHMYYQLFETLIAIQEIHWSYQLFEKIIHDFLTNTFVFSSHS